MDGYVKRLMRHLDNSLLRWLIKKRRKFFRLIEYSPTDLGVCSVFVASTKSFKAASRCKTARRTPFDFRTKLRVQLNRLTGSEDGNAGNGNTAGSTIGRVAVSETASKQ